MILKFKSGDVFATGRITRGGSSLQKVGKNETSLWSASLQVSDEKTDDGYIKRYLSVKAWRRKAEAMPALREGDMVIVTGKYGVDTYTGGDGQQRERETITVGDYDVLISMQGFTPAGAYRPIQDADGVPVFSEIGEDGELPF